MTEAHGVETVLKTVDEMIEYSDRRTAAEIRALPDGVYRWNAWNVNWASSTNWDSPITF